MPAHENPFDLHFPKGGMDVSKANIRQPWRPGPPAPGGRPTRIYTTPLGRNVRSFDPITRRERGGSRVGLTKYVEAPLVRDWVVQELTTIRSVIDPEEDMPSQGSLSGRIVNLVAVSQGNVYVASPGDTTWTATTNNASTTPPLAFTGIVRSACANQKMFFVDGRRYRYFTPIQNTVQDWTATAGTLPEATVDGVTHRARLIALYRGRLVLSGIIGDPQNWFMTRVRDPFDVNYGTAIEDDPISAISGSNARVGLIGDVVTALMAYSDDEMIFGGDSTIYVMRGDPMQGGQIDLVTDQIGVAFGEAFTQDPRGNIFFMANTGGIYVMNRQSPPEEISVSIRKTLQDIDTGANNVRLLWDDRFKCLHVFITNLDAPRTATRHFCWESHSNAWWIDRFGNGKHNPLCCTTLDGNNPSDRVPLIGSSDGFVRSFDPDALTDDGTAIESEVWIGPLLTKDFHEIMLKNIQGILAEASGDVDYSIHVGRTPEAALSAAAITPGTFSAGRNLTEVIRRRGHAIFIRLTSTNRWALEGIRAAMSPNMSKVLQRGL
jgi:hypothetical protein